MPLPWNYRIVRYKDGSGFGLHRVYYKKGGFFRPDVLYHSPCIFTCDPEEGPSGIILDVRLALQDLEKFIEIIDEE
jgi:hypothetical protein